MTAASQTAFRRCVQNEETAQRVEANFEVATKLGVSATPTFIIEGRLVQGVEAVAMIAELAR